MVTQSKEEQAHERFEKLVAFLIASVTVLAAIIATLQVNASGISQESNRAAQTLSIQATEKKVGGLLEFNSQYYGVFLPWQEADLRAYAAGQDGDTYLQQRYEKLRDQLRELSPLFKDPYYDTQTNWPNINKYEAEKYIVESTRLSEEFSAEAEVGQHWSNVANAFVVQLMLLAVGLSLFGISTTIKNITRWLFVGLGILITLFSAAWAGYLMISPPPQINHEAINAYAAGAGQDYQLNYDDAIVSYTQAIHAKNDYADAYYARGNAYISKKSFDLAVQDYESAIRFGKSEEAVNWNLAWASYLLGDFEKARGLNDVIIKNRPEFIGVISNQALIYLSEGNFDQAGQMYDFMLQEAARQINNAHQNNAEPPSSLYYYLDAGAFDLQSLIDKLNGIQKDWTEAPDPATINVDHEQVKAFAAAEITKIKEAAVSLEYTNALPTNTVSVQVQPLRFGNYTYDDQGQIAGFDEKTAFPSDTTDLTVLIDYAGLATGDHSLLWKVYYNGYEERAFRVRWTEGLEEAGAYERSLGFAYTNVFYLLPGEYVVEVYIDARLVQSGTFQVESSE